MNIIWSPALVGSGDREENGWMVLVNGKLMAILVHFSDEYPDPEMRSKWFLEAGFGPLFGKHAVFSTQDEADAWIRHHIDPKGSRPFQA